MRIRHISQILLAFGVSILMGLGVRSYLHAPDACSEAALDSVLAGGELLLPPDCRIYTHSTKAITGDVTIRGQGRFTYIGAYYEADAHRVFLVRAGGTLRLEGIIVADGQVIENGNNMITGGAGILNYGRLELVNSYISDNRTRRATGAGIYNAESATAYLENTEIDSNSTLGAFGAGIYNAGQMTILNSSIQYNLASEIYNNEMAGFAAGIFNEGELTLDNTAIHDNTASLDVAILNVGELTMTGSSITHNTATSPNRCSGGGAGISNSSEGTVIIENSTISHNRASKYAGGVINWGEMVIRNSAITHNDACTIVGGIMNIMNANLTIENSIIAENTVRGMRLGMANLATTDGHTPTFMGRNNYWGSADGPGGDGPGSGDGIYGTTSSTYTPWLATPPDWAGQ